MSINFLNDLILNYALECLLYTPLITAAFLLYIKSYDVKNLKVVALIGTIITFLCSVIILYTIEPFNNSFQYIYHLKWFEFLNLSYTIGLDGLSLLFILLTTFLMPLCLLTGWYSINYKIKSYLILFILTEFFLLNVFLSLDIILFYIYFESILIPMFLIIGIWGSRERRIHAAYQFFIYTLIGSLLMLIAVIFIYSHLGTTDIKVLYQYSFSDYRQIFLWLAFFCSFAVKVPMMPVHIWLPEAHVEAPTAGSVLLAGVLLKLGTYGFLRFSIPLFPYATQYFVPFIYTMSLIAIVYASFTTIRQIDLKKIIAYSSVVHMNFALVGLFTMNLQSLLGSVFLMLSHGIVSGGLFLGVGILYDRYHTRVIKYFNGLNMFMPLFSIIFLFLTFANIGFPGTSSFVGEFLIILGVFQQNPMAIFFASSSLILGAVYAVWLYNRIFFGSIQYEFLKKFSDISKREFFIMLPIIFFVLTSGIYPKFYLDICLMNVINIYNLVIL